MLTKTNVHHPRFNVYTDACVVYDKNSKPVAGGWACYIIPVNDDGLTREMISGAIEGQDKSMGMEFTAVVRALQWIESLVRKKAQILLHVDCRSIGSAYIRREKRYDTDILDDLIRQHDVTVKLMSKDEKKNSAEHNACHRAAKDIAYNLAETLSLSGKAKKKKGGNNGVHFRCNDNPSIRAALRRYSG